MKYKFLTKAEDDKVDICGINYLIRDIFGIDYNNHLSIYEKIISREIVTKLYLELFVTEDSNPEITGLDIFFQDIIAEFIKNCIEKEIIEFSFKPNRARIIHEI